MTITIGALLALSFLISVLGLFMFIWAQMNGLMRAGSDASEVIFAKGEVGVTEEPSISAPERAALQYAASEEPDETSLQNLAGSAELEARIEQDRSGRREGKLAAGRGRAQAADARSGLGVCQRNSERCRQQADTSARR